MAREPKLEGLRKWLEGERTKRLRFSDLWRLLLINLAERKQNRLDEERLPYSERIDRITYSYDLALIAEEEGILASQHDLQRIASYFEQHGWADVTRRAPVKLRLTARGEEEAHRVLDDVDLTSFRINSKPPDDGNREHAVDHLAQNAGVPASDRFVYLNDNTSEYAMAVEHLERLIRETSNIRINDWPEKEGMLAALTGALESIRTRYVNKAAVLAAVSSVVTFILVKFAEAPISELANATWATVKALFR